MPMGFSDEDVRRAMFDMFGDDGSSPEWGDGGPAPQGNMPPLPGPVAEESWTVIRDNCRCGRRTGPTWILA